MHGDTGGPDENVLYSLARVSHGRGRGTYRGRSGTGGADIAVPIGEQVNLRGGFSVFGLSRQFDNDGIALDAQLTLRSISAHVDWCPFGGGCHLSPGLMLYNGIQAAASRRFGVGSRNG